VDSSPRLVELAREGGGYETVVCSDAADLPLDADAFDIAIAFMSLHDIDDPGATIAELARVLGGGGTLCIAMVHPLNRPQRVLEDYFGEHRTVNTIERGGVRMRFEEAVRPLGAYTRALADAGFVIEDLREPRADDGVRDDEPLAAARRRPYFLHLRCRLT
jgi:SAM-dependent methyltransferase